MSSKVDLSTGEKGEQGATRGGGKKAKGREQMDKGPTHKIKRFYNRINTTLRGQGSRRATTKKKQAHNKGPPGGGGGETRKTTFLQIVHLRTLKKKKCRIRRGNN